jgi:acyl carrier protein
MTTPAATIKQFILTELTPGSGIEDIELDDDLFGLGVLDSHGIVELVGFVEGEFGIAVKDDDLTPENFLSLAQIEQFVERSAAVR